MPEVKTDVVIGAKARGFERVQQSIAGLFRSSSQSIKEQIKGFATNEAAAAKLGKAVDTALKSYNSKQAVRELQNLEKEMQQLARDQAVLTEALKAVDEGSKEYEGLNKKLDETSKRFRDVSRQAQTIETAFRGIKNVMSSGAFTQGFLQGSGIGAPFIQRGPGMGRQVAGQAVGAAARTAVGGFGGVGGLAQGLSGVPVVGGALAGQLQTTAGFVQRSLAFEQQRAELAPFLAGIGAQGQIRRARMRGMQSVARPGDVFGATEIEERARAAGRRAGEGVRLTPALREEARQEASRQIGTQIQRNFMLEGVTGRGGRADVQRRAIRERVQALGPEILSRAETDILSRERAGVTGRAAQAERERLTARAEEFRAERRGAGARAAGRAERRIFGGIESAGLNIGIGRAEAEAMAAQIAQVGGGGLRDLREQGLLQAGFGARRAFGVQEGTIGAFLQAGRRGGLVGGRGAPGEAASELQGALEDAMRLGLEGAEINTYLQQIAGGIQEWKQTGIPFNARSMADLAQGITRAGLDATRAQRVSGGVMRTAQQISRTGPQNALEMQAFQALTGFQGGSIEEFEKALIRLERGKFVEGGQQQLFQTLAQAGGRLGGVAGLRDLGIEVSRTEAAAGVLPGIEGIEGFTLPKRESEEERKRRGARSAARLQEQGLPGMAAGMVSDEQRRQVQLENQQLRIGKRMTNTVQNLESAAKTINDSFSALAKETIEPLSKEVAKMVKVLPDFITVMQKLATEGVSLF